MRHAAERHQAFVQDFQACQRMDGAACQAALAYPQLSDTDRVRLMNWKRNADQHQDAIADFRRNHHACQVGSIAACSAAINARRLDPSAIPELERQRARLQQADQERQAALAELRQSQRNCYSGSISACTAAMSSRHVAVSERSNLQNQRDRLQRAEQQRQAAERERQRQAAIREYERLRTDCAGGKRPACSEAAAHAQVRSSDIAFFKQRDRELAPLTERRANVFSAVNSSDGGSSRPSMPALIGVLAICAAGLVYVVRTRAPAPPAERVPPSLTPPVSAKPPTTPTTIVNFPLTGHMSTDVRRALLCASS